MKGLFHKSNAWFHSALPLSILFFFFGAGFLFLAVLTRSPWMWGMFDSARAAEDRAEDWVAPAREVKAQARLTRSRSNLGEIERLIAKGDFDDVLEESRDIRESLEEVFDDIVEIRVAGNNVDDLLSQTEAVLLRLEELVNDAESKAVGAEKELLEFELSLVTSFNVR